MIAADQYPGLCTHCEHAPSCTYPRRPGHRIRHCDEFAGRTKSEGARARGGLHVAPIAAAGAEQDHKGLCSNCAERDACTFPRPEGGIWRCEEYR